jgi:hypothetical protein
VPYLAGMTREDVIGLLDRASEVSAILPAGNPVPDEVPGALVAPCSAIQADEIYDDHDMFGFVIALFSEAAQSPDFGTALENAIEGVFVQPDHARELLTPHHKDLQVVAAFAHASLGGFQ